jgi:pre-mRNA-splicing factor 18
MDPIAKLKAEMEAKKRKLGEHGGAGAAAGEGGAAKKKTYRTNGQAKQMLVEMSVSVASTSAHKGDGDGPLSPEHVATQAGRANKMIPKEEVIKRLRALRAPITLFGEEDEERLARLRKLELLRPDEDNEGTGGQKNFLVEEQKKAAERALLGKGEESSDEEELTPEERKAKKMKRLAKMKEAEDKAQVDTN